MDLVNDHAPHVPQMPLHHLPGEDRLESLGGRDENVRGDGGLLAPFGGRGVAMPDGRGQSGRRHETLDPIDQVPVEGSQRSYVEGADPAPVFGGQGFEDRKERGLGLSGSRGSDDQYIGTCADAGNRGDLHFVEALDSGSAKENLRRDLRLPPSLRCGHQGSETDGMA